MEERIALERAKKIADAAIKRLEPYCQKIEVAGSVRRRRPWVKDIDFVLIPGDLWNFNQEIKKFGQAKAAGPKLMRIISGSIQLDFYIATPETWATLLLIRTGSVQNNIRLCARAKEMGWKLHADGTGLFNDKEERIAGDTEFSIYNAMGLRYQEPWERN